MPLTNSQRQAAGANGNAIVVAGAGTGKTRTLVERCVRLIREGSSLDQILMVTFTEAAAAEMRHRIRSALEQELAAAPSEHIAEQLALIDTAAISTLHSFCLQLVRQHFYELHLDPDLVVFDSQQTQPMIREALDQILQPHYASGPLSGVRPSSAAARSTCSGPLGSSNAECDSSVSAPEDGRAPLSKAVQELVRRRGRGSDFRIRQLLVRLHQFTQSLPNPDVWLKRQVGSFSSAEPLSWRTYFPDAIRAWRAHWLPVLEVMSENCKNVAACHAALCNLSDQSSTSDSAAVLTTILEADRSPWPRGAKITIRASLKHFFNDVEFLSSLCTAGETDPLVEDWGWVRDDVLTLLQLTQELTLEYTRLKRERGGVDFADLEQLTLKLLVAGEAGQPTPVAVQWQQQLRYIFVDEYQDINAAQDAVIQALSRSGSDSNRFLVGDVKQSIYRFRLANPKIFQRYHDDWKHHPHCSAVFLTENFRSREAILQFVNALFSRVMRRTIGGLSYDAEAQLRFGDGSSRQSLAVPLGAAVEPRVELHLILRDRTQAENNESEAVPNGEEASSKSETEEFESSNSTATAELLDLLSTEKEARLIARRLRALTQSGHLVRDARSEQLRPVEWRDIVILLRSPANRVESFAKEFSRQKVPLAASRGGFFQSIEISDLLSLLRILDNPLQDIPLLAVLRSPLVGLSLDELAEIRACCPDELFWTALMRFRELRRQNLTGPGARLSQPQQVGTAACFESIQHDRPFLPAEGGTPALGVSQASLFEIVDAFCRQFERWRDLSRITSLSHCLETVLAETHYQSMLLAEPHGDARVANVTRLLDLVRQYDPYQRQGLFRFLNFVAAQEDEDLDLESVATANDDAVRLMSIHKSKGLEFPVVVVADIGKSFNFASLHEEVIIDEELGLCPQVIRPGADRRYPSLPYWMAQRRERAELVGEEMRLLYVALTRARDTLILTGVGDSKNFGAGSEIVDQQLLCARSYLDWLKLWLPFTFAKVDWSTTMEGLNDLLRWVFYTGDDTRLLDPKELADAADRPLVEAQESLLDGVDQFSAVQERMNWEYPFHYATVEPAKTSVSALRRRMQESEMDDSSPAPFVRGAMLRPLPHAKTGLTPAEAGTAHHLLLQLARLDCVTSEEELQREANRLVDERHLSLEQRNALDLQALVDFWRSELGRQILRNGEFVRRELPFTARFSLIELAELGVIESRSRTVQIPQEHTEDAEKRPSVISISSCLKSGAHRERPANSGLEADEFVVIQGVIDLAVIRPEEIWVIDFKTDAVTTSNWQEKANVYSPQLKLYSHAMSRIYHRPVTACWLHFLAIRQSARCA